jgi:hypothetical protein
LIVTEQLEVTATGAAVSAAAAGGFQEMAVPAVKAAKVAAGAAVHAEMVAQAPMPPTQAAVAAAELFSRARMGRAASLPVAGVAARADISAEAVVERPGEMVRERSVRAAEEEAAAKPIFLSAAAWTVTETAALVVSEEGVAEALPTAEMVASAEAAAPVSLEI